MPFLSIFVPYLCCMNDVTYKIVLIFVGLVLFNSMAGWLETHPYTTFSIAITIVACYFWFFHKSPPTSSGDDTPKDYH